ncbi:putative WEB family protein At1g65010, chloroplastic isoform X2 [Asparagus officinalis]|uniref:putative WEB family protein At1g65010, chloroplastic isoform X2 n=1 Tax=Asparagus officinalis TaxID=4686 RepID=UPI00098E66DA|nr:putative WEB family protein At1g65010, chloroplastic isoform X2 [Asparagus officinalis]
MWFEYGSESSEIPSKGSRLSPSSTQSRSVKGLNFQVDSQDSKAAKVFDKKTANKPSSWLERRSGKGSEMPPQMYQLQEELRKAREERTRALEDLEELRSNKRMSALSNKEELDALEKKVEKAKESERKMLEAMISQTKQLEQTKILLEEAKLEIRSLHDNIKSLEENSSCNIRENIEKQQRPSDVIPAREEIISLKNELKLATRAEEKSKKAMDDLAVALKEVTTEVSQMKAELSTTQSELEKAKLESERSKSLVKITDDKLRAALEDAERLRLDSEDYVAGWKEKEHGIMSCIKMSEEENAKLKLENKKLLESLRGSREETSKLRDIVKQALNEATVVKEALEIVRNENSHLKDLLSVKESSLQCIKQEFECLKVSEAAAVDSVKELKGFLDVASSMVSKTPTGEVSESKKVLRIPSIRSCTNDAKKTHRRRHSVGDFGKLKSTLSENGSSMEQRNPLFSSFSNVSECRIPSSIYAEDGETLTTFDFDHVVGDQSNGVDYGNGSPLIQKKRKPMLKKFGGMLNWRSFHRY